MSLSIRPRDLVWYLDMPGVAIIAFGIHFRQWGLLLSWGRGWFELIVLCFQVTCEPNPLECRDGLGISSRSMRTPWARLIAPRIAPHSRQMMPERIQLRRTKGWRMPPNTVKVDRSNKAFGNPFSVEKCGSRAEAVKRFRQIMTRSQAWIIENAGGPPGFGLSLIVFRENVRKRLPELRGKNLACWCKRDGEPCHADVLLELANKEA